MPKFQSIVLSLYLGSAAAAGCYPAYSSGGTYSKGSAVSQSVTTTTPVSYASCTTPSSTCINGWITTGGVSTTTKYNFVCSSDVWCSVPGYTPGGTYSDLAWTKDSAECSGTQPAPVPPTPAAWTGVACPDAYVKGAAVAPGASRTVTTNGVKLVYTCADYPASGWCPLAGYEPGSGLYWQQAWTLKGSCDSTKTFTPTASPVSSLPNQGGCPLAYATDVSYVAGDLVSKSGMVFKCNPHPMSLFCSSIGYEPLKTEYGDAYKLAWTTVGPCKGTIAPITASPLSPAAAKTAGCPAVYSSGVAYRGGDLVSKATSNPAVVKKYECKAYPESLYCASNTYAPGGQYGYMAWTDLGQCFGTLAPTVTLWCNYMNKKYQLILTKPFSASAGYVEGDEVLVGNQAFKCKVPGWCNQAAYAPALSAGIWTNAWNAVGICVDNSHSPSSNPSSNPSGNPSSNPSSNPSGNPSSNPSGNPSSNPSSNPSGNPSSNPSGNPSSNPSSNPSGNPSSRPSDCKASGTIPPGAASCPVGAGPTQGVDGRCCTNKCGIISASSGTGDAAIADNVGRCCEIANGVCPTSTTAGANAGCCSGNCGIAGKCT